ncbi:MAG: oligosaccharyl transferase, archaeosortase A system-associated [ANME-2 cluster archaeon]|nr:oligosaccharyl transferase, archaeosortase A system-associated [ANME-2 cluster archaeon]
MDTRKDSLKNDTTLMLSIISILAIFIRLLPFSKIFVNGTFTIIGWDPYYHMRRIFFTAHHFPDSITFDSYLNYPYGLEVGWPPLFDQVIAFISLINGLGSPDPFIIQATATIFPVLLGIIVFIPLYFAASMIFDRNVALVSVLILAILPTNINYSMLGSTDHHIAEVLLLTTSYAFVIAALKSPGHKRLSLSRILKIGKDTSIPLQFMYAICAGFFLALSLFTWIGAPIFIGIISLYVALQYTADLKKNRPLPDLNKIFIPALCVTLVLTIIGVIRSVRPGLEMSPIHISWFQVLFVLLIILSVVALTLLAGFVSSKRYGWWSYPFIVAISMVIVIFIINIISQSTFGSMKYGVSYLLGYGDVLSTIAEAQPLIQGPQQTLTTLLVFFGSSIFLAIPALVLFIHKLFKEEHPPELLFFASWTLVISILSLSQIRFVNQLSIIVAILTGYFIIASINVINSSKYPDILKVTGIAILFSVAIIPTVFSGYQVATNPQLPSQDWVDSMEWLKENTPATSYYDNPFTMPEYGIMSWWSYGNWILYLSERPVVTNNFQAGMEDAGRFFIESNASGARSILDARNVRYIVTTAEMVYGKNENIALAAGENPQDYTMQSDTLKTTTMYRLHIGDGAGLGHYRLLYESKAPQVFLNIKGVKIFEYVNGANITGQASPHEVVVAFTNITTNQNRVFTYFNTVEANETGWYTITVAYPTPDSAYLRNKVEPYKIINSRNILIDEVSVHEDDIIHGRDVV